MWAMELIHVHPSTDGSLCKSSLHQVNGIRSEKTWDKHTKRNGPLVSCHNAGLCIINGISEHRGRMSSVRRRLAISRGIMRITGRVAGGGLAKVVGKSNVAGGRGLSRIWRACSAVRMHYLLLPRYSVSKGWAIPGIGGPASA